jgi:hypothetical protein
MAFLAVHNPQLLSHGVAALRLHGCYSTISEAQSAARTLAREQTDVPAYVIDECMRWVPVREPTPGSADAEEEIAAPENDDPSGGRMGSVCDMRKRIDVEQDTQGPLPAGVAFDRPTKGERASRARDGGRQRTQLERLLLGEVPGEITTLAAYALTRERYALLRAFERRLVGLSLGHCRTAMDHIAEMDGRHPTYRVEYRAN